jgi:hypothetical protein
MSAPATTVKESEASETKLPQQSDWITQQNTSATSSPSETTNLVESSKEYIAPVQPRPKPITLVGTVKPVVEPTAFSGGSPSPTKQENKIHEQVAAFARRQPVLEKTSAEPELTSPQHPSPGKLNINRLSRFIAVAPEVDKSSGPEKPNPVEAPIQTRSFPDRASTEDVRTKPQPRSPSLNKPKVPLPLPLSLPSRQQSPRTETETEPVATESNSKMNAIIGTRPLPKPPVLAPREPLNTPVRSLPKEPERDPRPLPSPGFKSPAATVSPLRSPTKQSLDISVVLQDFFGSERPRRNYRVDAAEVLIQRSSLAPSKIQTLSEQLFQLSMDGKKQPAPAHHERTLFEREMYLCSHTFKSEAGRNMAEVYFWAGDEVPESSIEDAAIVAAREARSFGGTLVRLRQGRETAEFIQALGGIVITQRGSGNKYDSLAPHMLCGRRYHGHVVFDEVDFTPAALCSGFPYLITQRGRCYLWKGKGSSVDELSCARLIGMDYALSGEMEEIEEGREPATFWDLFDGANRFGSADHWRLKPNYDKYCSRLFLSDAASRKQVRLFFFWSPVARITCIANAY